MDWSRRIDEYCERVGPDYWAEPLNALTNLGFIAAALIALAIARREGRLDPGIGWLIGLVLAVGVGSFLFHTHARLWAAIADTLPITVFILSYLWLAMRRFFGLSALLSTGVVVGFLGLSMLARKAVGPGYGGALNGSEGYFPALIALAVCGLLLFLRRRPAAAALGAGAAVFAVSLGFRTVDPLICDAVPAGSHFVWHLLNAALLGLLLIAMIRHGGAGRLAAPPVPG